MQAAVACNTQALVQRNIAARAVRMSKQATPARVSFSPCGTLMAWVTGQTLVVRDRRARRQIASQPLPSQPQSHRKLSWSYDSSHVSVCCASQVVVLDTTSCVTKHIDIDAGKAHLTCVWAPSARVVALVRAEKYAEDDSLSVFEVAGQEARLQPAQQLQLPQIESIKWAANSKLLAVTVSQGHRIFSIVSQALLETMTACNGLVAWSPCTWDAPHLLSFSFEGNVNFFDQTGRSRGDCVQAVRGVRELLWGEHGVLILGKAGIWLFTVCTNASGLSLTIKCHVAMPELFEPVLSPDQLQGHH